MIFNWPILLMPLHIVFIELVIDPACSMAFKAEPAEPGIIQKKTASQRREAFRSFNRIYRPSSGRQSLIGSASRILFSMRSGHTAEDARTIAFATLVVGNVVLIWANRSAGNTVLESRENRNPALWLVTFGSTSDPFHGSVCAVPKNTLPALGSAPE